MKKGELPTVSLNLTKTIQVQRAIINKYGEIKPKEVYYLGADTGGYCFTADFILVKKIGDDIIFTDEYYFWSTDE